MQTEEFFYSEEGIKERELKLKVFKNCGIYVIQNTINNHIYIGSSINLKQRFSQHKSTLRNNTHKNKHLQSAWNKYGEENFEFIIIEHTSNIKKVLNRENIHIRLYKPEYNNIQVNNDEKFFHSEETKKKIGEKSKQKFINNPNLLFNFIESRKGKPAWNKGLKGIYTLETRKKISEAMKKRTPIKHSKEIIDKIVSKNSIPIYQYDLEGNFIKEWKSATEAARFYNAKNSGNFCKAVKEGIKLYNSYWKK